MWTVIKHTFLLPLLLLTPLSAQVAVVSTASYAAGFPVAPNSIASAFGQTLSPGTEAATVTPLPTNLASTEVTVVDSAGQSFVCQLFFVSPGQINFLVPPGAALGTATIRVGPPGGIVQTGTFEIASTGTGIFTVTELAWLAGFILRVDADGTQTFLPVVELRNGEIVPVPLQMSPGGDESASFYLIIYGTGNIGSGDLSQVRTYIGFNDNVGSDSDLIGTLFNGLQGNFVGLGQTNAGPIPRTMEWLGGGDRAIGIEVERDFSNLAWINVAPNPNAPVVSNASFVLERGDVPRMNYGFDFLDADGDLGPMNVRWLWEDDKGVCLSSRTLPAGPFTGDMSGRVGFNATKINGTMLGPITRVTFLVADAAGHVSNELVYVPELGTLGNFNERCDQFFPN